MKLGKICAAGFLIMINLNSCNLIKRNDLEDHIENVREIDSSISKNNWKISIESQSKLEHRFELEKYSFDTSYYLYFSYFPKSNCYAIDGYVITYFKDSIYNEISLSNGDTLYHYTANTQLNQLKERSKERIEKQFLKGKEYYIKRNNIPVSSMDDPIY